MRGRSRHESEEPKRDMMAFLEDVEDAATVEKEHIQKMTETNATMLALCKQLAGTNAEQKTLIKELKESLAKKSHLKVPFSRDKYKGSKEDRDTARTICDKKKPCTHCGEIGHLPKRCYSLEENVALCPA